MTAATKEVLTPFLLRSSTPAPSEKVLRYLEGMSREGDEPDNTPPRSLVDSDEFRSKVGSPRARSPQVQSPGARSKKSETLFDPIKSPKSYAKHNGSQVAPHDDDADSNVQEGRTSEAGDTMIPAREPGPHDPPGPKYESYDSGPSFGNFGPLPSDDHVPVSLSYGNFQSASPRAPSQVPWSGEENGHKGVQSVQAAKIPLPPSEYAMSPRGTNNDMNRHEELMSPRSYAQLSSGKDRPMSPSGRSQLSKTSTPLSPRLTSLQGRSKAPSISPSESPSQVRPQQTPSRNRGSNSVLSGGGYQSRPFSPYRHGPTTEDLLHAAIRGHSVAIPEEEEKASSVASAQTRSKSPSQLGKTSSQAQMRLSKAPSQQSKSQVSATQPHTNGNGKEPSVITSRQSHQGSHHLDNHGHAEDGNAMPRARSPDEHSLDQVEARIVDAALAAATPRTSYFAEPLEPGISSHYHDMELCVLLHQEGDPNVHDVVKRALRKAVVQRVKKLGMKYDHESLKQYKRSHMDHNPLRQDYNSDEPPHWASDIKREIVLMQQRIESLGPKIENLGSRDNFNDARFAYQDPSDSRTPRTQTVHLQTQPTGTAANSMFQGAHTNIIIGDDGEVRPGHPHEVDDEDDEEFDNRTETQTMERRLPPDAAPKRGVYGADDRDDSPGQQFLEEELYRLRQRQGGSQSGRSHHTWLVSREPGAIDDFEDEERPPPSGMPTIPDTNGDGYAEREGSHSPPLPELPEQPEDGELEPPGGAIPTPQGQWRAHDHNPEASQLAPWQHIHARLLSWAVIWPQSELDVALNSTTRGQQVDEVALSIWTTQTYKRYVRKTLTDNPIGIVDRLFVPPNMADAISNAVYNGQHGNACGMLRDLWSPFGLPGMPRLLVVLARHRSENDHWVVHRYSLPEGTLMTYDSYAGRSIMDGRPLGWWFAIRIAWPNANYPSPDHLEQKMVRLHRPAQLPIDNSVAAAGIWRNILMGSRGERSLDLERLRDLINTEVKNLRQRKILGRLAIPMPRQDLNWEH